MASQLTPQQALIYAMIAAAAVDRSMGDAELARIGSIIRQLPAFRSYDQDWLVREAGECGQALRADNGLYRVLDLITASLPEHLRETAYVLAAEVAASDMRVGREEIRFLELLAGRLDLDKLTCAALERAARARHQKV
jgi:uncharacterized membrane protein YebE (DUF533 family)